MTCRSCGAAIEEDSAGMPPTWVRETILDQQGIWSIRLIMEADRLRAVSTLRALLGLDLEAAGVLIKGSSSTSWSGTQVECNWLAVHLKDNGVEVAVKKRMPK